MKARHNTAPTRRPACVPVVRAAITAIVDALSVDGQTWRVIEFDPYGGVIERTQDEAGWGQIYIADPEPARGGRKPARAGKSASPAYRPAQLMLHLDREGITSLAGQRMSIHGIYPPNLWGMYDGYHDGEYKHTPPVISVAADRPAAEIAADMRARIIPDVEHHTEMAERIRETMEAKAEAVSEARKRLLEIAGASGYEDMHNPARSALRTKVGSHRGLRQYRAAWEADVKGSPEPGKAEIDMTLYNLDLKLAEAVARLLAGEGNK